MLKTVGNPSTRYGDQTIIDGNLVIGTSGKGIDFSTTSDATGMTSELLDDYEEGRYTPTFTPSTSGTIGLNSVDTRDKVTYTKVGRLVTLTGGLQFDGSSSPVGASVTMTLPFVVGGTGVGTIGASGGVFFFNSAASGVQINQLASTLTWNVDASLLVSGFLYFSISYFSA